MGISAQGWIGATAQSLEAAGYPQLVSTPLPPLLAAVGTDEYRMPPAGPREIEARQRARATARRMAPRLALPLRRYLADRRGTAATLRAIDVAAGGGFFRVPPEAEQDRDAADACFAGGGPVIDVQTHYVASARSHSRGMDGVLGFIQQVAPERFAALDRATSLGFAEYLRCIYVESETALAILTAAPGVEDHNILPNDEIAASREILDRCAGSGRLLHHVIVHPDRPGERERLPEQFAALRPAGLKVYTLYGSPGHEGGWRLDDEEVGLPFLEAARDIGVGRVCAHKGLSALSPTGSPADVGPAARAFPELDFLIYHSGYEVPVDEAREERAYRPGGGGTNRLIDSLRAAGIAPLANVWAELGSTWACLLRRPLEAAHVVGKLLLAVGPERMLWGTDSVWYGPAQPLIDAFRAFQIPQPLQERHGYPELTPELKDRILGGNAAQAYGLDLDRVLADAEGDDLAWLGEALRQARDRGLLRDSD